MDSYFRRSIDAAQIARYHDFVGGRLKWSGLTLALNIWNLMDLVNASARLIEQVCSDAEDPEMENIVVSIAIKKNFQRLIWNPLQIAETQKLMQRNFTVEQVKERIRSSCYNSDEKMQIWIFMDREPIQSIILPHPAIRSMK